MRFQPALLGLLGLATSVSAMINATEVVSEINEIAQLSSEANAIANNISSANSASTVPELVNSLHQVTYTIESDITTIKGSNRTSSAKNLGRKRQGLPILSESQQRLICGAVGTVAYVEMQLQQAILRTAERVGDNHATAPIAAALRILEQKVDEFYRILTDLLPVCQQEATASQYSIRQSLDTAIGTLEGQ